MFNMGHSKVSCCTMPSSSAVLLRQTTNVVKLSPNADAKVMRSSLLKNDSQDWKFVMGYGHEEAARTVLSV